MTVHYQEELDRLCKELTTTDLDGDVRPVTGGITRAESQFIIDLIRKEELARCLETGVAHGVSTLSICGALSELEGKHPDSKLIGVDPLQFSEHSGAALALLERCELSNLFELLEGPSHRMLPKLLDHAPFDFVFIDGWHTFDFTLVDVFYADQMLRPGGFLLLHDFTLPSKKKIYGYIKTHRSYRRVPAPRFSWINRLGSALKHTMALEIRQSFFRLITDSNLLVLRKESHSEPDYDYFKNF